MTEYPKRPKFWANRLIRLLHKSCAANSMGIEACWLVVVIVQVEDSKRYSSPVTFWTGQLLPVAGFNSWDRLDRARKKAVECGWLHYRRGTKIKAAEYWATVPDEVLATYDDSPVDEIDPQNADSNEMNPQKTDANADQSRIHPGSKHGYSIPTPTPIPKELASPGFLSVWEQWQQHRREIKKPLTPTSTTQQLNKLAKWGPSRAVAALEHTITNGWQGIREPEAGNAPDDWEFVRQKIRAIYQPEARNVADVKAELSAEQFRAADSVGLRRIADCHPADRQTAEAYRTARKDTAS